MNASIELKLATEKVCKKCNQNKLIENFRVIRKDKKGSHYLTICIQCRIETQLLENNISSDNFIRVGLTTINAFVKENHNGKCLSTIYKNNRTNLLFECKWGHQWEAMWTNIKKGKWCPYCSSLSGERSRTRLYFESIFNKKFPHMRPNWLLSSKGFPMELDGYCSELGIAFEHHGMQHFIINEFSNSQEKLDARKLDDKLKIQLCKENGVKLIVVPQVPNLIPIEKLTQFIYDQCQTQNITIHKDIENISVSSELEPISFEYLKKYQDIAIARGGKCLSSIYINSDTKMQFECSLEHQWWALPDNVNSKRSWCPQCNNRKNK